MALSAEMKQAWRESLRACASPWILFGLDLAAPAPRRLSGMAGLIDWSLHGQVSCLIAEERFDEAGFCLLPTERGSNFLAYQFDAQPDLKSVLATVRRLQVRELSVSVTTFPKDFCVKLKQNLEKEGVRCSKLEPVEAEHS